MAGIAGMLATSIFLAGVYIRDSSAGTLGWNVDPTIGSVSRAILELSGALGVGLLLRSSGSRLSSESVALGCWAFARC